MFSFTERLLHPGANTADIITTYISTIKALRTVDPTGGKYNINTTNISSVTLDAVSEPIRSYLRMREDTIRCIVSSCTEDQNSELFEELSNSEGGLALDEEPEEEARDDWEPDPIEADPNSKPFMFMC